MDGLPASELAWLMHSVMFDWRRFVVLFTSVAV